MHAALNRDIIVSILKVILSQILCKLLIISKGVNLLGFLSQIFMNHLVHTLIRSRVIKFEVALSQVFLQSLVKIGLMDSIKSCEARKLDPIQAGLLSGSLALELSGVIAKDYIGRSVSLCMVDFLKFLGLEFDMSSLVERLHQRLVISELEVVLVEEGIVSGIGGLGKIVLFEPIFVDGLVVGLLVSVFEVVGYGLDDGKGAYL